MLDKRLLVNIAKGGTAWAGLNALVALPIVIPALITDADVMTSYAMTAAAVGVWVPTLAFVSAGRQGLKDVGNLYVDLYNKTIGAFRHKVTSPNQIKTK